jgi:hypothetical protein
MRAFFCPQFASLTMPLVTDTQPVIVGEATAITATFAASARTSNKIFCSGNTFLGINIPTTFTAGNLSFYGSLTGTPGTFYQLTDAQGDLISIPTGATASVINPTPANAELGTPKGIYLPFEPTLFAGLQNLIIYCSNAQVSEQQVQLSMAPLLG